MILEVDELKVYLREDSTDADVLSLIVSMQLGAEIFLANAGVNKDYANDLYKLAIRMLVTHWYDNRVQFAIGKVEKIAFTLDSIIFSIKYNQPAPVVIV